MSKFNKSQIMSRAWEIAREMKALADKSKLKSFRNRSITANLWRALELAWEEAKEAAMKAEAQITATAKAAKSQSGRYVEYLSKAKREGLNHGRGWMGTAHNVDSGKIHPEMEGEMICYVYA
ncbi:MAG: hypothetical protein OIF55_19115 [Amphritea sp.]|nr:hypothetical protein [Amphritea sp.]